MGPDAAGWAEAQEPALGLGPELMRVSRQPCQLPLWAFPSPRPESEGGQAVGVGLGRAFLPSRDLASTGYPGGGQRVMRVDRVELITAQTLPETGFRTQNRQKGRQAVSHNGGPAGRVQWQVQS